jgi:lysophospholipase L1-like esterase
MTHYFYSRSKAFAKKNKFWLVIIICTNLIFLLLLQKLLDWRKEKISALSTPVEYKFTNYIPPGSSDKKRLILLGDSRIAEWSSKWPKDYTVINRGIHSSTSFQSLERIERDVLVHKPDWVIIQVGINDIVASRMLFGSKRVKTVSQIKKNLRQIIKILTSKKIHVILMTVVPDIDPDWARYLIWQGGLKRDTDIINTYLLKISNQWLTVYNSSRVFSPQDQLITEYAKDALHWQPLAYSHLTKDIVAIINH